MVKFSKEDKEEVQYTDRIPFGVTPVQITLVTEEEPDNGAPFLEVSVIEPQSGAEENVRLYMSDNARKYTFNTIKAIAVHNVPEDKKDAVRSAIDNVEDSEAFVNLINEKMIGNEAWFTKYYDPERTYTGKDGKSYKSVNTNLWGFEPKLKPELMPAPRKDAPQRDGNGTIDPNDYPDDAPITGEQYDGKAEGNEVPFSSKGDAPGSVTIPEKKAW